MNRRHKELRDAPALPAKGFQSCTPRPRPRLCTPTPPCPSVPPSCPVAHRGPPRGFAHPSLDLQGVGGGTGDRHVPHPGSAIASPLLRVPCHLCKYLRVPSHVPGVLGWGRLGGRGVWWDPPPVPVAVLGAAPTSPSLTPMGAAPMGAWQLPGAVLHLGVGSALIPPPQLLPTPPQGAPGGDRDAGTGSVKIKPLFDWLDTGYKSVPVGGAGAGVGNAATSQVKPRRRGHNGARWWQGPLGDCTVAGSPWGPHGDGTVLAAQGGAGIKRGRW